MKLGAKLRLSYVGIVLMAVAIVLILTIENAQRAMKEKIGSDLQCVAKLTAEDIDTYSNEKTSRMRIFSRAYALKTGDSAVMSRYLGEIMQADPDYDEISITDASGKIMASTDAGSVGKPFSMRGKDEKELSVDEKRAEHGYVVLRSVRLDDGKEEIKAFLLMTVMGKSEEDAMSVLIGRLDMEGILKTVDGLEDQVEGKGTAYLAENPGTMIVTEDGKAQVFTPLTYVQANPGFRSFLKGEKNGYTIYRTPGGEPVIAGYADMGKYGTHRSVDWVVISMAPQKEMFSPAIRLRNRIIVVGIIAVIVAWIASFFVAHGITSPILKLAAVAKQIADGDLSRRADIELDDEVGDLARSFNRMNDELDATIISRDQEIAERKKITERLREVMDTRSQFVSMMSYEFKTPPTAIKASIGILLKEMGESVTERQKQLLVLAGKSVDSLKFLTKDIIEFYKLETDKAQFDMAENDVNKILEEVRDDMAQQTAVDRSLEIVAEKKSGIPGVRCDREKIKQVLKNIVNIAIKFTQEGSITLAAEKEGNNAVRVSVKDTGVAISEEELPRLFHKFEHPEDSRDRKAGGTGLGLAISREIIEKHGGKIWAESKEGRGTTFYFVLPIRERRGPSEAAE